HRDDRVVAVGPAGGHLHRPEHAHLEDPARGFADRLVAVPVALADGAPGLVDDVADRDRGLGPGGNEDVAELVAKAGIAEEPDPSGLVRRLHEDLALDVGLRASAGPAGP